MSGGAIVPLPFSMCRPARSFGLVRKLCWRVVMREMSTHAARKSFICYALSIGIPPVMVMQWTGHSDYQSMKPYIDIASADKSSAMQKFADGLE